MPLGCFVSGGIDSPLVAAYAGQHSSSLQGYTVGVDDPEINEAEIAATYCDQLSLSQKILHLDEDEILQSVDDHFLAYADPVGDSSSLPTFAITRLAREHVTVMLAGDGGDELYWGYPRFLKFLDNRRVLQLPAAFRRGWSRLQRIAGKRIGFGYTEGLSAWMLDTQSHLMSHDLQALAPDAHPSPAIRRLYEYEGDYSIKHLGHWLRYNEFYGHMQRVLAKVDRASMGNSLEVRVPFLCKDVIRQAWSLECQLGAKHREPKLILKKALERKVGSINRRKMGFGVPISKWLRTCFREELSELAHHPVFGDGILDGKRQATLVDDFLSGKNDYDWGVWILYSLQKWATMHYRPALHLL